MGDVNISIVWPEVVVVSPDGRRRVYDVAVTVGGPVGRFFQELVELDEALGDYRGARYAVAIDGEPMFDDEPIPISARCIVVKIGSGKGGPPTAMAK